MKGIRKAKLSDVDSIKRLIERSSEFDVISEVFTEDYYEYFIRSGVALVAEEGDKIIGVCFGNFNIKNNLAEMKGLFVIPKFRKTGIAGKLVEEFESFVKKKGVGTIIFYAKRNQGRLFKELGYKHGGVSIPFRKRF